MSSSNAYRSHAFPQDWVFLIACGITIVTLLGSALYAFQRYGGEFVDGLDDQIGELVAKRAKSNAVAGLPDAAIRLFEEALSVPFMDEDQRLFCIQDFSTLLIDEGKFDEALAWIEEGVQLHSNDSKLAYLRFRAFREPGRFDEALAAAVLWYAVGKAADDATVMRAAKFAEATVYRDTARPEKALDAFLAAHELKPGPDTAVRAGGLCVQLGQTVRAREFLTYAANASGADAKAAQEMLGRLPE